MKMMQLDYIKHNDHKFDYVYGIAQRKHIIVERIRYIGKETNNIDETNITGLNDGSYTEYNKDYDIVKSKEFQDWVLNLKPKDVRDKGISHQTLYYQKSIIISGKILNIKQKVVKLLIKLYKKDVLHES